MTTSIHSKTLLNEPNVVNELDLLHRGINLHCFSKRPVKGMNRQINYAFRALKQVHRCSFSSLSPKETPHATFLMKQMNINEGRGTNCAKLRCKNNDGAELESGCFLMVLNELAFYIQVHWNLHQVHFGRK